MPEAHPVRSFWTGTITFGLVSIPVEFVAAIRPRQVSMKLVDTEGHPVGRDYVCSADGRPLTRDDLTRGYETKSGEMIVITDEDLEALAPEATRDITLQSFVPLSQVAPMFFDRPYFLAPADRSTKAYLLLAETMKRTGRAGIGTFVMRGHEHLVAILSDGGVLRAETLRFASELRTPEDVGLPDHHAAPKDAVRRMRRAIDAATTDDVDPSELSDRYADALAALAEAKRREGRDVVRLSLDLAPDEEDDEEEQASNVTDIMKLIKQRMGERQPADAPPDSPLEEMSKKELYERAKDLEIAGRSAMTRDDLIRAIRAA